VDALTQSQAASVAEGWASDVFLNTGRDSYTDQGEHHFQFQFLASRASLPDTLLEKRARQQVQPPIIFDRYEGLNRPPWEWRVKRIGKRRIVLATWDIRSERAR